MWIWSNEGEPDLGVVPEIVPDHLDCRLGVSDQSALSQGRRHEGVTPASATSDNFKFEIQIKTLNPKALEYF